MTTTMLPDLWRRDLPASLAKTASGDVTHECHKSVRQCLHKIVSRNAAGDRAGVDEQVQRAHEAMDGCDEAELRAAGVSLDDDDAAGAGRVDTSRGKAAGYQRFERIDLSALDPKKPDSFRKALTAVRRDPQFASRR